MPRVTISKEVAERVRHFSKVIDAVIGKKLSDKIDDYVEFILEIGMRKMILDPLPESKELEMTILAMFEDNPEYLCDFMARVLTKGKGEKFKKPVEDWLKAYE